MCFFRYVHGQYVFQVGEVVSHINITSVTAQDGGTYSCIAKNRLGETKHSANLNIYG